MRVLKTSISNYMYIYVVVICLGVRVIDLGVYWEIAYYRFQLVWMEELGE